MKGLQCLALASSVSHVVAQFGPWAKDQVSTSICLWYQPRAALVRDTIYIDGGSIWWQPGMKDGSKGELMNEGNYQGNILTYHLGTPYDDRSNVSGILLNEMVSKARGGRGNSNDAAPNYYDGALLFNDDEFFLYGGTIIKNPELSLPPDGDDVLEYQAYQYGPQKDLWNAGFYDRKLGDKVNRYIAFGASANAPSEKKSWHFSGLVSPLNGPIYNPGDNASVAATEPSNSFITLDTSSQLEEIWKNDTLPKDVKARSNAEVIWVPVGKQGILVVIGGVTYPEWAGTDKKHHSDNETASTKESADFMQVIDIYDVASDKWYKQPTTNAPKPRARGCAVVVPAQDASSFNIYYYGGFDGIHPNDPFYDETWVLSLPSFTWTLVNKGTPSHARAGHKCFLPYPDQMMVLGGYTPTSGSTLTCLNNGPVVMFNTTSGEWIDGYDPAKYSKYGVPDAVTKTIGGNAAGGAKETKPSPSGWAADELGDIFSTKYDMSKIQSYSPYKPGNGSTPVDTSPSKSKKLPSWAGPVIGVTLGIVAIVGILLAYCLWRRRKSRMRRQSQSHSQSSETMHSETAMKILAWIRGQPKDEKHMSAMSSTYMAGSHTEKTRSPSLGPPSPYHHEVSDTQVIEMGDTSTPVELPDTSLTPGEVARRQYALKTVRQQSGLSPLSAQSGSRPSITSLAELGRQTSASAVSETSEGRTLSPNTKKAIADMMSPIDGNSVAGSPQPAVSPPLSSPGSAPSPSVNERGEEDYLSAGFRRH